jgi:superfamily I DNA/RNA helicase
MLIVDEAQDLKNEHIFALFHLLKAKRKIIVFSDAKQSLFVSNWSLDETMFGDDAPVGLRLDENWRNTNLIHDRFRLFEEGDVHSMIFENARPVEKVQRLDSALEKVLSEGRRPCDLAVLCASREQVGNLPSSVSGKDGRKIKFTDDLSVWRKGSRILKTTVRSFKGLESPIVFFCEGDLDDISEDRYVGESRAKYELYIVSDKHD